MFRNAVEQVVGSVRPIHVIRRRYGDNAILPDIGTLFFVNDNGYAITSKRTANIVAATEATEKQYRTFLENRNRLLHDEGYRFQEKRLENEFKYSRDSIIQLRFAFMGCAEGQVRVECISHPKYDLALLHFTSDHPYLYRTHVTFAKEAPKQGQTVCRLGFAVPEFNNFAFNSEKDAIEFVKEGKTNAATFASDGMVTRFIVDDERTFGVETTNPCPQGMIGAPLFDTDGHVLGMQSGGTGFMMLGSDVTVTLPNDEKIVDRGSIRLSICIHPDVIKDFLRAHNVRFFEA